MREVILDLELWPRQLQAFDSEGTEILFGGATEGGKSHLLRVALITWCLAIPGLQCVLIRKKIDDIIKNHVKGPTGFEALLSPLIDLKLVRVTVEGISFFGTGAYISFVHCQDERQFNSAQGVEKHVLVIDEATQISERLIRFFRTWVRMPMEMKEGLPEQFKGKFPRILYTANPIGISVSFFRRAFVKARPAFEIEKIEGFLRQYIPSKYTDNGSVDEEAHKGRLAGLGDQALAKALDEGDWDAPVGDFFPEYSEETHVIPDFEIPTHWFKYRAFDWGGSDPFAVLWVAVSDGEEFVANGQQYWFPRGALVIYREWYGCDPLDPAKGVRMSNESIAEGILHRTSENDCSITLTDSLPFQTRGGPSIAQVFRENGVSLDRADTARESGWSHMRDRLKGRDGFAMIYIQQKCKFVRDYIPALPRHPTKSEDAAEHGEATHVCDVVRYLCAAYPVIADKKKEYKIDLTPKLPTFTDALEKSKRGKHGRSDY